MSTGVLIWLRKHRFSLREILWIGDILVAILPFGIMLGRIGNFFNQELYGITATEVLAKYGYVIASLLQQFGLMHIYPQVDMALRVNTNLLASIGE